MAPVCRVEQADRNELPVGIEDHGQIARARIVVVDRHDRTVEDPRVPAADLADRVVGDTHGEATFGGRRDGGEGEHGGVGAWSVASCPDGAVFAAASATTIRP